MLKMQAVDSLVTCGLGGNFMSNFLIEDLDLTSLDVDLENPRHEVSASQREAFIGMLDEQKEKLLNLADDILKNGINPSDLPIVIPHDKEEKRYTVLEGNRRVTALKLLSEESLAESMKNKALAGRFKRLSKKFQDNPVEKLKCVLYQNKKDAIKWIRLKHTGENKGIGIVQWGAKEKARFEHNLGKPSVALQAISFVQNNGDLDEKTQANFGKIHITNLERLLGDKDVQKFIGFYVSNGKLYSKFPKEQVLKGLKKIVCDIANKEVNVTDIYYKDQRKKYIREFEHENTPNLTQPMTPWAFDSVYKEAFPTQGRNLKKQIKAKPLSTNRRTLIPIDCRLNIGDKRINSIYRELREIIVDDYVNACCVLFRVFLELSIDDFLEKKGIVEVTKKDYLKVKFRAVSKFFEKNKILSGDQLKPLNVAISNPHSIFSIETFHAYVHNKYFQPTPKDLKLAWENIQNFLEKIWEEK